MCALLNCTDRLVLSGNGQSLGNMQITALFVEEIEETSFIKFRNIQKNHIRITDILAITTDSNFLRKMTMDIRKPTIRMYSLE